MTSSWMLTQRRLNSDKWAISNFGDPNNALGGWEDHYMIPGGTKECHPDYIAHPIGDAYGFMICARKKFANGMDMSSGTRVCPTQPADQNGWHRKASNLYDQRQTTQSQMYNPDNYYRRTVPNEEYLHANDYLARPLWYSGTGVAPTRTPGDRRYSEYGYSFTQSPAPMKYDVSRLHQVFPIWEGEQAYLGTMSSQQVGEYAREAPSSTMGVL